MVSNKSFVTLNVSKTTYIVFKNRNMHFDPNSCNISIENEIPKSIGNDCVNKYFKFVGLKLDKFINWDFQIEHISNKVSSSNLTLSQIKNILPFNILCKKRQSERLIIVLSRHIQIHYF